MAGAEPLSAFTLWFIVGLIAVIASMVLCSVLFSMVRHTEKKRVLRALSERGEEFGKPLIFHSPDDVPKYFKQFGFKSSTIGRCVFASWIVFPAMGYILMIVMCYLSYTVANGYYFPPSAKYWQDFFGSWEGIMMPWCILFTVVHVLAGFMSKMHSAGRARAMFPCVSMRDATHIVIDEDVPIHPDDCYDPDEIHGQDSWLRSKFMYLKLRFRTATTRVVQPIVEDDDGTRYIEYTCVRYVYSEEEDAFLPKGEHVYEPHEAHHRFRAGGLSHEEAEQALSTCGPNEIHVRVPGIIEALVTEFMDFTYIFNSVGTWSYIATSFWNVGFIFLGMTVYSGLYRALGIVRPNQRKIAEMATMTQTCDVLRDGEWLEVEVGQIALGDILKIGDGPNSKLPCDGIVVAGSVVVNESMLTGEPMPIAKSPVENSVHAKISNKLNKCYAGTQPLESTGPGKGKCIMIVTNVGALTTRGQLLRMVLFPASVKFKYNEQLPIVYCIQCVYILVVVIIIICVVKMGSAVVTYLMLTDTVAMCVSPMLPVSLVMGQSVSAKRLEDKNGEYHIKCLQPGRIPIAGKISTMVFDKTGTITKDGMDFAGLICAKDGRFQATVHFDADDAECHGNRAKIADPHQVPPKLRHAVACCHSVKQLKDGRLVGNQVECAMIRTCGWKLSSGQMVSPSGEVLTVIRELEFDHHRMTSGAVVQTSQGDVEVFFKGSYEKIRQLSGKGSLPTDYDAVTTRCAKDNYYTLGIATKTLPRQNAQQLASQTRDQLEANLEFCGLVLFRNEIKSDSAEAIQRLRDGGVRSVLCTGDNELTGISIGRTAGIVTTEVCLRGDMREGRLVWSNPENETDKHAHPDTHPAAQLAVTYTAWRHLLEEKDLMDQWWQRLVVFGRMQPDDKVNVVRFLQSRKLVVGMAGDGGNDCGGLRAAHVGLALSDAEASIVSPFSTGRLGLGKASKDITLNTVPDLIREGRACLSTNIATFQYFMVYGFTMTTMCLVLKCYAALSMGEWVWISTDLGIGVAMMYFMTQSRAHPKLAPYRPTATLLGFRTISAIAVPFLTGLIALGVGYSILWSKPWYDHLNPVFDIHVKAKDWMKKGDNYDSPLVLLCAVTTCVNSAYIFSYGGDFRRNIGRNLGLNAVYALFIGSLMFLCVTEPNKFSCVFRVNCDAPNSVACADIPVLAWYSVGSTGGCFLGPQVKYWQEDTKKTWAPYLENATFWLPETSEQCMPPAGTLARIPLNSTTISPGRGFTDAPQCSGPNNCYSAGFKWTMLSILVVYILVNHAFARLVLMGPVARGVRASHQHIEEHSSDESEYESSAYSEDKELLM